MIYKPMETIQYLLDVRVPKNYCYCGSPDTNCPEGYERKEQYICYICDQKINPIKKNVTLDATMTLYEIVKEIMENHNKIIDDWCKAYMAQLHQEGHDLKPGCFTLNEQNNIELSNGKMGKRYWFESGVPFYPKGNWIYSKEQPPSREFPIIVVTEYNKFPTTVQFVEDGIYGEPSFFESNEEYECPEEHILYWMPAPKSPTKKKED